MKRLSFLQWMDAALGRGQSENREGFEVKIQRSMQIHSLAENIVVGYEPLDVRYLKYHDMPQLREFGYTNAVA
jgi:hypothetical protein